MGARQYTQREWRLLSWWLATYHPSADIVMNVRVGPVPPPLVDAGEDTLPAASRKVRNRWADAIYFENGAAHIVEAKLLPDPGIFSTLIHYSRKFRADPQFRAWADRPLHLVALVYHDDPSVAAEAPFYGVRWVVYQPQLAQLPPALALGAALPAFENPLPANFPARLSAWGIKLLES